MITAPNRRVNEKIYITVTCASCGAKNQVIKGRLSNCEYCGQRLNSMIKDTFRICPVKGKILVQYAQCIKRIFYKQNYISCI